MTDQPTQPPTATESDPDPDAEAVELLRRLVANAKDRRLELAEAINRDGPPSLSGDATTAWLRRNRAIWQAAHDLLERHLAGRCRCCELKAEVERLRTENADLRSEIANDNLSHLWKLQGLERDNSRLITNLTLERARASSLEADLAKSHADCRFFQRESDWLKGDIAEKKAAYPPAIIDPAVPRRFRWSNPSGAWRYGMALPDGRWVTDTGTLVSADLMPQGVAWIDPRPVPAPVPAPGAITP